MPSAPTDPTLPTGCAAVFVVASVPDTIAWYTRMLGFDEVFRYGEPVHFGAVCRGQVSIQLQAATEAPRPLGGSCLTISVGDARSVHAQLVAAGVEIEVEPAPRDYGLVDFSLLDPDGNRLVFGSEIEAEAR